MDCPQCADLKVKYDTCFKDNMSSRVKSLDISTNSVNKCEEPFHVSDRDTFLHIEPPSSYRAYA